MLSTHNINGRTVHGTTSSYVGHDTHLVAVIVVNVFGLGSQVSGLGFTAYPLTIRSPFETAKIGEV